MLKRFLEPFAAIGNVERIEMTELVIANAGRTPVGAFSGGFSGLAAHNLGEVAIKGVLERAGVPPDDVSPEAGQEKCL